MQRLGVINALRAVSIKRDNEANNGSTFEGALDATLRSCILRRSRVYRPINTAHAVIDMLSRYLRPVLSRIMDYYA